MSSLEEYIYNDGNSKENSQVDAMVAGMAPVHLDMVRTNELFQLVLLQKIAICFQIDPHMDFNRGPPDRFLDVICRQNYRVKAIALNSATGTKLFHRVVFIVEKITKIAEIVL